MAKLKIGFMGNTEFSQYILYSLVSNGYNIASIYTNPPAKKNRGQKLANSPCYEFAMKNNISVYSPKNFKQPDNIKQFIKLKLDLCIVAAYGLILPESILQAPRYGCINVHASILPRWRGASPIEHAILNGDSKAGVTIMFMTKELDAGDIISIKQLPITHYTTAKSLYPELASLGSTMILSCLEGFLESKQFNRIPQNHSEATYAPKLQKIDGKINFNRPAIEIVRQINAFNIFPVCYFNYSGETFKVHQASIITQQHGYRPGTIVDSTKQLLIATSSDTLSIEIIQRSGKKKMPAEDLLKGFHFAKNDVLS